MNSTLTNQTLLSCLVLVGLIGCGGGSSSPETNSDANTPEPGPQLNVQFTSAPPPVTTDSFARFTYAASDANSYECKTDLGEYRACSSPLFIDSLDPGRHSIDVRAVAVNGTRGDASTFEWNVGSLFTAPHKDLVTTNQSPAPVAANSWRGILRINCDFSHSSYNDPIIYPGQENAAHLHRFYGNMLVDQNTSHESLLTTGSSSCQGNELNRSAYWVPALLAPLYDAQTGARLLDHNNQPAWQVVPAVVGNDDEAHEVFYYSAGIDDLQAIKPVPPGLRMIAGTASTMPGHVQDTAVVRWHCQSWDSDDSSNPLFSATIPVCSAPDRVRMDVFFPSCWNGTDLDSQDHKSHMAYPIKTGGPNGTICPDSHPIAVVRPSYHYAFGVKPEVYDPATRSSKGWRLASDMYDVTEAIPGGLSLHADWINGWHPQIMTLLLQSCIQSGLDCHDGNLGNGYRLSGTQPGSQIEPDIINSGMGRNMSH